MRERREDAGEEKEEKKREKGGEKIKRKRERKKGGPKRKEEGPFREVEGRLHETEKKKEGGCKVQGVGKEKASGRIRVWFRVFLVGLLGLASWAALSLVQNIFFLQNNFDN